MAFIETNKTIFLKAETSTLIPAEGDQIKMMERVKLFKF